MTTLATRNGSSERGQLLARLGERYGVDRDELTRTIKQTLFGGKQASNAELMTMLILADQHRLNPLTREFYAFPAKGGGMVPVVGVDGWIRIVNEHRQFDGMRFDYDEDTGAMTCTIWRKDRSHPIAVTEYLAECKRGTDPWKSHPRRMLRHKALIQCARIAFGFAGIYDEDEAEQIRTGTIVVQQERRVDPLLAAPAEPIDDAAKDVAEDEAPKTIRGEINEAFEEALAHEIWVEDAQIHAWVQERWNAPLKELSDEQLREVLDQVRVWNAESGGGE